MSEPCSCQKNTDRYVSFTGIDCNGMAGKVMEHIDRHLAIPERNNDYWAYFNRKRSGETGPKYDDLYMIHSSIHPVRELFELWEDAEGLQLLDRIEEQCC